MNEHSLPTADDDRYRAFALIRRLLTEQGLVHWRKYAVAFVLMAVAAGCALQTAFPQLPASRPFFKSLVAFSRISSGCR